MRMDRANELLDRALEPERQRRFSHELGGTRTYHLNAENLIVLLIADDLDEPLGFRGDPGAREHAEFEGSDSDIVAPRLRFRFRQAYAADLGIAIRAPGDLVVIDGTVVFS